MLLLSRQDSRVEKVIKEGRFSVEVDAARSFGHLDQAVKAMREKMLADLAKHGYEAVNSRWSLTGPEKHIVFSTDLTPDPGPFPERPPQEHPSESPDRWRNWLAAQDAHQAANKRLAAKRPDDREFVDYVLTGEFTVRLKGLILPISARRGGTTLAG